MRGGEATGPTLVVRNAGPASVDLRVIQGVSVAGDTIGAALGMVSAGWTACFPLQAVTTPQWLKVSSVTGTFITPSFLAGSRPAWYLELRGYPQTDRLGLEPIEVRCRPGQRPTPR